MNVFAVHILVVLAKMPGPSGIKAIIAEHLLLKQRNPRYGRPRIAYIITLTAGIELFRSKALTLKTYAILMDRSFRSGRLYIPSVCHELPRVDKWPTRPRPKG